MASFLSGLGAFGGGLAQGVDTGSSLAYKLKRGQREDTAYQEQRTGQEALMKALLGGGQPPMGPQMQPGQPSQPVQLPSAGGGGQLGALQNAVYGQESGYGANPQTSPKGAMGGMQITPGTFQQFARPGESITDPAANKAVGNRILETYIQKYGDPQRALVAYFSGPGNVAPPGSPTPWKEDRSDGRVRVSQYVQQTMARMGGGGGGGGAPQQQGGAPQPQQGGAGDWRSFAQRIIQSNPGITPGAFMNALQAASPFMSMESKQELAVMRAQMQGEIAGMRTGAMRDIAEQRSEDTRRGQDIGLKKTEMTTSAAMTRFLKAQEGIQNRFNQRFAQGERKIADAKTKSERAAELTNLRQAELDRRAATANAIKAAAASMDIEELKKLEAEERAARDEADRKIDQLTVQGRENEARRVKSGATPQAAPPERAPVKVSSPEEAKKLPSGTPIILPDGTEGVVP